MRKFAVLIGLLIPFAVLATEVEQPGYSVVDSKAGAVAILDASTGDVHGSDFGDRVPDAIAPSYPSANNCALGSGVATSIAGFGFSGGGHRESEECNQREDSTQAARLGDKPTAFEIMCAKPRFYLANNRAVEGGLNPKMVCLTNPELDREYAEQQQAQEVAAAVPLSTTSSSDDAFSWQIVED